MEKRSFKKYFLIGSLVYIIGYVLLFWLRLIYGYYYTEMNNRTDNHGINNTNFLLNQSSIENDNNYIRKNYASTKLRQTSVTVDQKYEKVASLSSKTNEFEKSEQSTRELIKRFNALIQFEESVGLKGNRKLNLAIGVHPDKFDEMTEEIKKIGEISFLQINKVDKTNEYKNLNASKLSLEKSLRAMTELKKKAGGKIEELINLENKIQEIEQSIQNLGVKLGEFDEENEFCTIKFTLVETGIKKTEISIAHRMMVAFEWTTKYYAVLTVTIFFAFLGIWVFLSIVEKLGVFQAIINRLN